MGLFTRLALRLAGLQIHCGLLPGAALIAPCGLQVPRHLWSGSPDRCAASPPGNVPKLMLPGLRCA